MTLRVDWLGLVEGSTSDLRGSPTFVGFNPKVLLAETFPAAFSPSFVLVLDDDDETPVMTPGTPVAVEVSLTGPDGEVLLLIKQPGPPLGVNRWSDVPARLQAVAEVPFTAAKPGRYEMSYYITIGDGDRLGGTKAFWIKESPAPPDPHARGGQQATV